MNEMELALLESINRILLEPLVSARIDEIAERINLKAKRNRDLLLWETVPMEIYSKSLPEEIRSSWVFLLREGAASGAERHPNSHQRVRSWMNEGDFQVRMQDYWESHLLENRFDVPVQQQWASIPRNVWHQAVVPPGKPWIVLSFHTAAADDLIEERPDPADSSLVQQRIYSRSNT